MQHIHLDVTPSTQTHLLEEFRDIPSHLLISCENQTDGFGRRGAKWDSYLETICFSATVSPHKNLSLTSLEIPVILKEFFKQEFNKDLGLKWPNDLMRENKKCGGIILNSSNSKNMVLGVGLNVGAISDIDNYPIPAISIFDTTIVFSKRSLASKIYRFILDNRISEKQIIDGWNEGCIHMNKEISIVEEATTITGVFKGIGTSGQALVQTESGLQEFFTGSLRL